MKDEELKKKIRAVYIDKMNIQIYFKINIT